MLANFEGRAIGNATGAAMIIDDESDPGSGPRLSIGDAAVYEGNVGARTAVFTVSLSEPGSSTVTVSFATASGTATRPGDFTAKSGSITFAPGTTGQTVKVTISPDTVAEGDEGFRVVMSGASSGILISDPTGLGTILDDD